MEDRHKHSSKLLDLTVLIGQYPLQLVLSRDTKVRQLWEIVSSHDTLHKDYGPQGGRFIALTSNDGYEVLDLLLTNMNKSLSRLLNRTLLRAIYAYGETDAVELGCFEFLKCLGKGVAGSVYLVRSKYTGRLFALKQIEKSEISDYRKFQSILREKKIMTELRQSLHTVKFHGSFESSHHLNFLLDFYPGGELFLHMQTKRLTEEEIQLYFCELILSLEHLHKHQIFYRDMKPENVLVDVNGHLCIADFGLSRCGFTPEQMTYSHCGSLEYMAPEVHQREAYGYHTDFYTLGVILFQFVTGSTPFYNRSKEEIQRDVVEKEPNYSEISNPEIRLLLKKLLHKEQEHRLASFAALKNSPWLKGVDWKAVEEKESKAPFALDLYESYISEEFAVFQQEVEELNVMSDCEFEPLFEFFNYMRPSSKRLVVGDTSSCSLTSVKIKKQKRKETDSTTGDANSEISSYMASKSSKATIPRPNSKSKLKPLSNVSHINNQLSVPGSTTSRRSKSKTLIQPKTLAQTSSRNYLLCEKKEKKGCETSSRPKSQTKSLNKSSLKKKSATKRKPGDENAKCFKIKL